jgi:hypothetical protein
VNEEWFHWFLDAHSYQPPIHGVARGEPSNHRKLHRNPKLDAIDRRRAIEEAFKDDELHHCHQAIHTDLPRRQR